MSGLGGGLRPFIFILISKLVLNFEKMVKRLCNPKTFGRNTDAVFFVVVVLCFSPPPPPPLRQCVCTCARARPVIWWHLQALPMQQCGWHCGSLHHIVYFLSQNVISSLAASLHMGSLHPAVVFITTAVEGIFFSPFIFPVLFYLTALNCCSPSYFDFFFKWSACGLEMQCPVKQPSPRFFFFSFAVLTWKQMGETFF